MSDISPDVTSSVPPPPVAPPVEVAPPPQYAGYTRNYGSPALVQTPEKLEALASGYFGLSWLFLGHFLWLVGGMAIAMIMSINGSEQGFSIWLLSFLSAFFLVPVIGYRQIAKIGSALYWNTFLNILFSITLAIGGIIGYIVMQAIAGSEIKKYGIKRRFFSGYKKKDIADKAAEMRASPDYQPPEAMQTPTTF